MCSSKYFPSVYSSELDPLERVRRIFKHASIERAGCRSNGQVGSFLAKRWEHTFSIYVAWYRVQLEAMRDSSLRVLFSARIEPDFLQALLFLKYNMTSCQLISRLARQLWDNVTPKLSNLLLKVFEAEEVYVEMGAVSPSFTVSLLLESV